VVLVCLFGLIAALSTAAWIGFLYLETKSRACECEDPIDNPRFAALNPFRNRAPEKAAIEVVKALQSGRCHAVALEQHYCDEDKIANWKLSGRTEKDGIVTIRFWITRVRQDGGSFGDPFWVTVQLQGSSWKVMNIYTYY
jgi:hypothetical protein